MAKGKRDNAPYSVSEIDAAVRRAYLPAQAKGCDPTRDGGTTAGGGADAPPTVTRGETEKGRAIELVLEDGKVLEIPARRGWGGQAAFVDWVNVTCKDETFIRLDDLGSYDDRRIAVECSIVCESIFGYGITSQRDNGANMYKRSFVLGDGYGLVCHGGQRGTLMISISGAGCAAAKEGWEKRLHDWLESAKQGRITRVDMAYDDYDGQLYTVDRARSEYEAGLFQAGGRAPDSEMRGNWIRPNGKGRTFYVGHAQSGKLCRIYEKGKQLGSPSSEWVRVEGQLGSRDRIIPFDILLEPGAYLAAMYPALGWVSEVQHRVKTEQKSAKIRYQHALEWLKHQAGALLWAAREVEGSADALLEKIMRVGDFPKRLLVPHFEDSPRPIHHDAQTSVSEAAFTHLAFS